MTGTLNLIRYIITGVNKPPNKKKTKTNCFTYTRWKKTSNHIQLLQEIKLV